MSYDIVVKNARIVDGTGKQAYGGDVAVKDGRIVAIGQVDGAAVRTIDAGGQVIAPGFIDAHTHYDAQLMWDPSANPSSAHGVTTVLMGNCGYTLAPVRAADQDYLMGVFSAAEEVPKSALQLFAPFGWETFPDYLNTLRRSSLGVNVVSQIGHSALRRFVMGQAALDRAATEEEIATMVRVAEEAMDAGAAGVSTSQAPHQVGEHGEHIPSYFATDAEVEALAAAVRRKGKRLMSVNPRSKREGLSKEDKAMMVRLAEVSGAIVSWNDFGVLTPDWESSLEFMEAEVERGHPIYAVARCQRPETRFTLKKLSAIFAASEPWLEFSRLDIPEKLAALGDPAWRDRMGAFWGGAAFMKLASVEKGATPATAALDGRLLDDIAAERGISAPEVMFDIALQDKLQTFFRISAPVTQDESKLERILKSPATLVGISDAGAHLQTFAGGDYTSYFLQHWVREKGSFTLEDGVAALTSRVAGFLGLSDRGTLEPGKVADLVIFDPDAIEPLPLQTLDDIPGGGTRMTKGARGISWVLVGGEPIIENGAPTGATPGQVLATSMAS
ncbi:N-acyl-D-aspartate/D-glutamate deacylase [Mycolicibacterium sp. BK556]|uniref:N-acyl-D-amino-acid deacylase family protein n=1 Tax=Mycobacteriaceae TaxID=1762 RepID=UPI000D334863|nr:MULTISPECIES: amidohydrolase family protein [Mycobacteriaceae]MBB3606514.1 N-acyl-D-aspartate/D-glutamate deacylase [Mycolicibacterium sp. BK556]MBB3636240.1 N-acyl-D-aspartate/D-glutamate deacylase [Mycolicibacterium sp. BK607]TDO06383.1 N-acyl-D-aspartate/D-glutamate deacylase [Mycobacterium sp. BK086]